MNNSNVYKIKLFTPHQGQRKILDALEDPSTRIVTVAIGRQFGKTLTGINWLFKFCIDNKNSDTIWCSRWHTQCSVVFKLFQRIFRNCKAIETINKSEKYIEFKNGSVIKFYSVANPDSIRGNSCDAMVADEFGLYAEDVYTEVIKATFASKPKYKLLALGTPKGKGVFYDLFKHGVNGEIGYKSIKASSHDSPFVTEAFINDCRRTLSPNVFKQEIDADFLDDGGEVFSNINSNLIKEFAKPTKVNYGGIDLGFINDWTVLTILNDAGDMVDYLRFQDETQNYRVAAERIYNFLKKYNFPFTQIEINAHTTVWEYLTKEFRCPNIHEFRTTTPSKKMIVEDLIDACINNEIKIIDEEYVVSEFETFEYIFNKKTRNLTYNARTGFHDDFIISIALANYSKKYRIKNKIRF